MIGRISKLFASPRNVFFISHNTTFKPKPIAPPKAPVQKQKPGDISLATVAQQLNVNEEMLRKQLLNPKTIFVNK